MALQNQGSSIFLVGIFFRLWLFHSPFEVFRGTKILKIKALPEVRY